MYILYDFVFLIFAIVYVPYLVATRRYHARLPERLGMFKKEFIEGLQGRQFIWLHAVSVGEVVAASSFIKEFPQRFPGYRLLISTVTKTGNQVAAKIKSADDVLIYFPLDISVIIRKVLALFNVRLFVIMETEIWPNIVTAIAKKNIPITVMNGRLSEDSYKAYRRVALLMRGVFRSITVFCMQSPADARRLQALGVDTSKIRVTGNMKYDVAARPPAEDDSTHLKSTLGINGSIKILVAGSTHRGEDEIIIRAYKQLLATFPQLRLLIVPRHPERAGEVEGIVSRNRLRSRRFSSSGPTFRDVEVIIVDVIGKLRSLYAISDIVLMGGSLLPRYGGHNLLEPATFKKPILFGPHMKNFKDMAETFLNERAAVPITDSAAIERTCAMLLDDSTKATQYGEAAFHIINQNQGATARNISCIEELIAEGGTAS